MLAKYTMHWQKKLLVYCRLRIDLDMETASKSSCPIILISLFVASTLRMLGSMQGLPRYYVKIKKIKASQPSDTMKNSQLDILSISHQFLLAMPPKISPENVQEGITIDEIRSQILCELLCYCSIKPRATQQLTIHQPSERRNSLPK